MKITHKVDELPEIVKSCLILGLVQRIYKRFQISVFIRRLLRVDLSVDPLFVLEGHAARNVLPGVAFGTK